MEKALLCECERVTIAEFEQSPPEPTSHSPQRHPPHPYGHGYLSGEFLLACAAWARCSKLLLPAGMQAYGTGGPPMAHRCPPEPAVSAGTASCSGFARCCNFINASYLV